MRTGARAPRVLVDLEVDYASEDNYLFAYITDISATGIFVRTTTPGAAGHAPEPALLAPTTPGPQIEVEGEVIWVNPYRPGAPDNLHPGMGIRFVGLDDDVARSPARADPPLRVPVVDARCRSSAVPISRRQRRALDVARALAALRGDREVVLVHVVERR